VAKVLRVIDSGVTEGRLNIALGQALIERHRAGEMSDTLRFLRFPPTALIGRHQALAQEVNVDFCRAQGIGLVRRITGGGAIFLDPGQLGWELVIHRSTLGGGSLGEFTRTLCEAAAAGLRRLGVDARFRPRNDIEVDGRKLGGTGGFFDGDTLFFQGTVLVDLDPELMVSALKVPQAKLAKRSLDSAAQRVVTLNELMGDDCPPRSQIQAALVKGFEEGLGLEAQDAELDEEHLAMARTLYEEEIGLDEFVTEIEEPAAARGVLRGEHSGPGGTVRTHVRLQGPAQNRIGSALITGDFFVTPPRVVYDLEGALRGVFLEDMDATLDRFFRDTPIESLSVSQEDFRHSLASALQSGEAGHHDD
jgi:lipoate-protein ligase A